MSAAVKARLPAARGLRRKGARRQDRHLGHHRAAGHIRPEEEIPGHRADLRGAARIVRAEDLGRRTEPRIARRNRLRARADRRHGHEQPLEGVPRCRWKNIADAGFPDRILWHKAVNKKYPWYDITRVGIYGTSAGGQNAAGAVFFHPEFYKVAVANSRLPRQPHGQDLVERGVDG